MSDKTGLILIPSLIIFVFGLGALSGIFIYQTTRSPGPATAIRESPAKMAQTPRPRFNEEWDVVDLDGGKATQPKTVRQPRFRDDELEDVAPPSPKQASPNHGGFVDDFVEDTPPSPPPPIPPSQTKPARGGFNPDDFVEDTSPPPSSPPAVSSPPRYTDDEITYLDDQTPAKNSSSPPVSTSVSLADIRWEDDPSPATPSPRTTVPPVGSQSISPEPHKPNPYHYFLGNKVTRTYHLPGCSLIRKTASYDLVFIPDYQNYRDNMDTEGFARCTECRP